MESEPYAYTLEQSYRHLQFKIYNPEDALDQIATAYIPIAEELSSDLVIERHIKGDDSFLISSDLELTFSLVTDAQQVALPNLVDRCVHLHQNEAYLFLPVCRAFASKLHYMTPDKRRTLLTQALDYHIDQLELTKSTLDTEDLAQIAEIEAKQKSYQEAKIKLNERGTPLQQRK
ncbi:MAG: hypothetical protein ACEQSA_04660 [Weeksellaceae bacterium]